MAGSLSPAPVFIGFGDDGLILPGGKVYTYAAGTTTPIATYTDSALLVPNANPIILNASGRCVIYLTGGTSYKFILKTSADVTVWSQDNILGISSGTINTDVTGTAGENLSAGDVVVISDGTGGRTAGRWYRGDADDVNISTLPVGFGFSVAAITSGSTGSVRLGGQIGSLAGLTPGLLYYISSVTGSLTSTAPTNARPVAYADSTTSILILNATQLAGTGVAAGLITNAAQDIDGAKHWLAQADFDLPPTFNAGTSTTVPAIASGVLFSDSADRTTTATGAEQTLSTFTMPANVLSANGKFLRITFAGKRAAVASNSRYRVYLGSYELIRVDFTDSGVGWNGWTEVMRDGANTQKATGRFDISNAAANSVAPGPDTANPRTWYQDDPAITDTAAIIIKSTCNSTADIANLTQGIFIVEVVG